MDMNVNNKSKKNQPTKDKSKVKGMIVRKNIDSIVNAVYVNANGQQPTKRRGAGVTKFWDTSIGGASPASSGTIAALSPITQGVGVSQRTGDAVYLDKMYLNYQIATANADIYTTIRIIIFQWHPNSALAAPLTGDILQTSTHLSFYDWQFSEMYTIIHDVMYFASGTGAGPTASSNMGFAGEVSLAPAQKKLEFTSGAATGSNQLYVLYISDSAIAPFPVLDLTARVTYDEN